MKTFAVLSGKGGVGKTIFSVGIAQTFAKRIRFPDEPDPRILLVDMDLHVRGLSFLMYPDLQALHRPVISSRTFLENISDQNNIDQLSSALLSERFAISEAISVLPSSDLTQSVDWEKVHGWKVTDVMVKLQTLIKAAELAGFNIVIFDTRAGPDNISLGAGLLVDLTFILLEQDRVSSDIALTLKGELEVLRKTIAKDPDSSFTPPSISRFVFLHNKRTDVYSLETELALRDLHFLPAVSIDLDFLNQYNRDPDGLMIEGGVIMSQIGLYIQNTLSEALRELRLLFTELPLELETRRELVSESDFAKFLREIPLGFPLFLSVFALVLSGFSILLPQLLSQELAVVFVIMGFTFLLLSGIIYWFKSIESRRPLLKQPGAKAEPTSISTDEKPDEDEPDQGLSEP